VESCRALKSLGYRIALDDFQWHAGVEALVELADYIKIDFLQSGPEERGAMLEWLRGSRAVLLAEKIETQAEFEQAVREGFELFQGYYFCRPELMWNRVIPANLMAQMELMQALECEEMDFPVLARLVKRDPSIAYRLLRMVNSAGFGMRWDVRSVEMALIAVGEGTFRRIAILAIAAGLCPTKSWEALRMALVRARFCELGAEKAGHDPTEQYLLGLFSLLPAMMQISMERAMAKICLREGIRDALLGTCNEESWLLRWMERHERGDWQQCDRIAELRGLDAGELNRHVMAASEWADGMLHPIG
jgi:EAL and modified HD-GYP domain-containing signal transduction protein